VPADLAPRTVEGVTDASPIVAVAAGEHHAVAVRADGSVLAWGDNGYGQLGNGTTYSSPVAVPVPGLGPGSGVVGVAAGRSFSAALRSNGEVLSWGGPGGLVSVIGGGDQVAQYPPRTPTPVPGLGPGSGVVRVFAAEWTGMALKADGTVLSWFIPPLIEYLRPITTGAADITVNNDHVVILRTDGQVLAAGLNHRGQLGNGTTEAAVEPAPVTGLGPGSGVVDVEVSSDASYARKADGTVLGWGSAEVGQPGKGPAVLVPTPVPGLGAGSGVTAIAVGNGHVLALKADGTVLGWGANWSGQAGQPSPDRVVTPTAVAGTGPTAPVRLIAARADHSLAVR
jgi:alpha-tubulin suppressor-like RCC1 family protein